MASVSVSKRQGGHVRKQPSSPVGSVLTGSRAAAVELERLLHLLSETEQRVTHRLSNLLGTERTSVAQWRVLVLLADRPGQPMTELARYTFLPPASVTRVIDGMVLDGLVYRTADARDRRRVLVHLTAAGRARFRRLADGLERRQDAILTPRDAARLHEVVDLLSDLLRVER
jgi:DNA-binding MarR family transcriptional regulator